MSRRSRRQAHRWPPTPLEVRIRDLGHDGRGVGEVVSEFDQGKTCFVHGALPGEQVLARLLGRNRQFDEAVVTEVIEASPKRVAPPCPWYEQCGGCALQHLEPKAGVAFKHKRLVDNLTRLGQVEPKVWADPLTADAWHYRRRARLSVRYVAGKGRVLVGFRERQGRFVADVDHCQVLDERFADRLGDLAELVGALSICEAVPQIEIACGDESAAMIIRHLAPITADDRVQLLAWEEVTGITIYLQSKGPDTIVPLSADAKPLEYALPAYDLKLEFLPSHFIQVNQAINEQLIDQALRWLAPDADQVILDLFCGLGNFTLPLAKRAGRVVGVEGAEDLVAFARANAQRNGIENATFFVDDLSEPNPVWMQDAFDSVLIDPPRSGAEAVLPLIHQSGAKRLVYVSCNPATLARDAGILVHQFGFELMSAGIADMFPHTAHVESIALFEKAS